MVFQTNGNCVVVVNNPFSRLRDSDPADLRFLATGSPMTIAMFHLMRAIRISGTLYVARIKIGIHPHNLKVGRCLTRKGYRMLKAMGAEIASWGISGKLPVNLIANEITSHFYAIKTIADNTYFAPLEQGYSEAVGISFPVSNVIARRVKDG